jgi:hypothetical protein
MGSLKAQEVAIWESDRILPTITAVAFRNPRLGTYLNAYAWSAIRTLVGLLIVRI